MRTGPLPWLTCLLIASAAHGQLNLDSLRAVWNDLARPDTMRLKAMNDLIRTGYLMTRPDSADLLARLEFELAERNGLREYMGRARKS